MLAVKRVYDPSAPEDGFRVLTDRLWPRGLSKEKAKVDAWLKEVAPSTELRKWFFHDPSKWDEFKKRYREELHQNKAAFDALRHLVGAHDTVTLLFGAKDETHNQAVVLYELLAK